MRAFARWRFRVWDKRLNRCRAIWLTTPESRAEDYRYWEAQVTKAMAKRTKWKKAAR